MADIISAAGGAATRDVQDSWDRGKGGGETAAPDDPYWYIEAFFFAYRDFIGDPDRILDEIGFGRAHHRVLHFVYRYPGMRVADLLDILRITKQSLARVLRELIKEGYVVQQSGEADRRERLLFATDKGGALANRLAAPQLLRLDGVLGRLGPEGRAAVAQFLADMVSSGGRPAISRQGTAGRGLEGQVRNE
jgi:DNA-binding MarR family transcriptional regulator